MFKELSVMMNTYAYDSLSMLPGANHNSTRTILELQEPPIYGTKNPSFKTYTASGVILTLAFMMALLLTTLIFVNERKEGQFERCLIAGVKAYQIFVTYISVQLIVMLTQVVLLLLTAFIIFGIPIEGSYALITALTLLQVCFRGLIIIIESTKSLIVFLTV
jgi:ABC-type transport system involved in cytochrome c biogenesis permease component